MDFKMRALLLLLVALITTLCRGDDAEYEFNQSIYDVTTIYQLHESEQPLNESEKLLKVPGFYAEDGRLSWKNTGWNVSESSYFSFPSFPLQVSEDVRLRAPKELQVVPLPGKRFDISVSREAAAENVFLFFMSDEDVENSDMLVVGFIKAQSNSDYFETHAYRCRQTYDGKVQLPGVPERTDCYLNTNSDRHEYFWDTSDRQTFRVNVDSYTVKITSRVNDKRYFVSKDLPDKMMFIGMKAHAASFNYSIPVNLVALAKKHGSLESPNMRRVTASLMCMQMIAYLHPKSESSVSVSVLFQNGTKLLVGQILPSKNEVELWRFISHFHVEIMDSFQIYIEASKNTTWPVLISGVATCNETGKFTNTVFNKPGSVTVHSRTNARGLPLYLYDGSIRDPSAGVEEGLLECQAASTKCEWEITNFTVTTRDDTDAPLFKSGQINIFEASPRESDLSKPQLFHNPFRFSYTPISLGDMRVDSLVVLLTDNRHDVKTSNMYYISIHKTLNHWGGVGDTMCKIYTCTENTQYTSSSSEDDEITILGRYNRNCNIISSVQIERFFELDVTTVFTVVKSDGRLTLEAEGHIVDEKRIIFNVHVPEPDSIDVTHVLLGTYRMNGVFKGISVYPLLKLTDDGTGSMVSPPLPPSMNSVCVSLLYYTDKETSINLFLQHDSSMMPITVINTWKFWPLGGWVHQNFATNFTNRPNSETRVVVMATKQPRATLLIQRVSGGCKANDVEDWLELSEEKRITVWNSGIDVAHTTNHTALEHITCQNGGHRVRSTHTQTGTNGYHSQTVEECMCPAGFTGKTCNEGCGANSFGADCGGMCSKSERGCRGMILCRPTIGCDCAPGFKGLFCDAACNGGEYGAGCRQQCGRCAGEACDIYTGLCHHGCEPGYFPPYCQELYSHLRAGPHVVSSGFDQITISVNLDHWYGHGNPKFYQIQYKEENASTWQQDPPKPIPPRDQLLDVRQWMPDPQSKTSSMLQQETVVGLKMGTHYMMRVVLIDETGASYQGERVRTVSVSTQCIVPGEKDYSYHTSNLEYVEQLSADSYGSFVIEWKFPTGNATWCAVVGYEVHIRMGRRWVTHSVGADVTKKHIDGLLPGESYVVKVRAVTSRGPSAFAQPLVVTTLAQAPDHVVGLAAKPIAGRSLKVSWRQPRHPAGSMRHYVVTYQCVRLLSCPGEECASSAGHMEVVSTSVQIDDLLPHAVYNVTVAGVAGSLGPTSSLTAATLMSAPDIKPSSANTDIVSRSNSSLAVQWAPPDSCRQMNGYPTGYRYELIPSGQKVPLVFGMTTNHSTVFHKLTPHSQFVVRVFVVNSAGWSSEHGLEISAKTRATTPDIVEGLTVYKRGRKMLGLRWSKPRMTYGSLASFTVTHRASDGTDNLSSEVVKLTTCPAWPHLFCHTIKNLKPDTEYIVTVQARNAEVAEDGKEVAVKAITKEGAAPSAPSFLRVVNKTDVSVDIEWGLPDMVNGQLRSFLVNIEQTDSANTSDCCQYFPIREVIVPTERSSYEFQMTGLIPHSTYAVSVSVKTMSMGPAVTLTVHTRPLTPVLAHAPKLSEAAVIGNPLKVQIQPTDGYDGTLDSYYLLLMADDSSDAACPISAEWLANQLTQSVNQSFALVAEFSQSELPASGEVEIHPGQPLVVGRFGTVGVSLLTPSAQYRLVLALVLDYCGTLSVGHILGEAFSVKQA